MKRFSLSFIAEIITIVLFAVTVLALAFLPYVTKTLLLFWDGQIIDWLYGRCLIILYPSGLIALLIIWHCYRILRNVNRQEPFLMDNAKRIKQIAILFLPLALIFLAAIYLLRSPTMLLVSLAFWIIALYAFVMGKLFKQAVIFKQENDLTI